MQTAQGHVNIRPTSSAPTVPPSVSSSNRLPHALIIPPPADTHPRSSSILTPPPSAHPNSLSHQPSLIPSHGLGRVSPGDSRLQHQHANQLAMHVQTPQHVSPSYPQQHHHHQRQQQQVLHAENGVTHAQLAPTPPPPPPQIAELKAPRLRPSTLPLEQQQHQEMTHPTTTVLTPVMTQARPSRTPSSSQAIDAARLHGPQQEQPHVPGQTPPRGLHAQLVAFVTPGAPGTQARPQRGIQSHMQVPERPQTNRSPMPAPSPSSTQAQAQSQAQQQRQQERLTASPAIAAFRVLQPAKALFEKTWSTAIAAVQQELVVLHSEHVQSVQEQQRLSEEVQRMRIERGHILQALQDAKARLTECLMSAQMERKARIHFERKLVDMSAQKCTCGVATAKKVTTTTANLIPPPPSSSSPLPSSSVAIAPPLAIVEGEAGAAPAHSVTPTTPPFLQMDKPRELRREREEETVDGETASKRRRITPSSESAPSPTSAAPAPEPKATSTPEISGAQNAAEPVVPTDKNAALLPQHTPRSTPAPESTLPVPNSEQEQPEDPPTAAGAGANGTSVPRKIGIQHIQLAYEAVGDTLQCRMCLLRKREVDEGTQVATYSIAAAYDVLVGHCEKEHEAALDALASMTPSDIAEMHQRMQACR